MMSLQWTLAWCAVQVGVVAALGVTSAWALGRRSPASAAMATASATATIVLMRLPCGCLRGRPFLSR